MPYYTMGQQWITCAKAQRGSHFGSYPGLVEIEPGVVLFANDLPAGPTDPKVGVIGVWNTKGKFLGCVVNFACHATTGPGGISADWIYYLEKTIRGLMGEEAVVVFVSGMGGDVTQVDNRNPYRIKQFGEVSSRYVGGRVGAGCSSGHGACLAGSASEEDP